jgi:superfamily II DNA or RNA helicase
MSQTVNSHQAAFIAHFFRESRKRLYLLQAAPGLGATYTVAHIVQRALVITPGARILILTPSRGSSQTLQAQMQGLLMRVGVKAEAVDRYRYRELQDSAPGNSTIWHAGTAFVLSVNFAKQHDVAQSLVTVPWTLLIVDEARLLGPLGLEVVRRIIASSKDVRVLLLSATGEPDMLALGSEPFTTTRWHRSEVVDQAGESAFSRPSIKLEYIEFHEEHGEQLMRGAIEQIARQLQTSRDAALLSASLLRLLASSPAALEDGMRRFRNRLAHGIPALTPVEAGDDDETDSDDLPTTVPENREELLAILNGCLKDLDFLTADSKLSAFIEKLAEMRSDSTLIRLGVLTEYRATLFYLQAQLEEAGFNVHILHGSISLEEVVDSVDRFGLEGGVLLATTGMTEGIDLPQVAWLVLYDLPRSPGVLAQIYGRFQPLERTEPLRLSVLHNRDIGPARSLNKLREVVADAAGED